MASVPSPLPESEPVLVTGATGLLGQSVVAALRAAGEDVRILVRDSSRSVDTMPIGCDVVRGDVTDRDIVRSALRSVRAVYHLAAVTQKWLPDQREFARVNVDAAVDLARLAAEAGVERVVHVSSFTVYGPSPCSGALIDEHARSQRSALQNEYQRSKHDAHEALTELAVRGDAPVVVACPGVIYGIGEGLERNPIADLMQRQLAGRLGGFPALDRRWTLAWAPDVAVGLRLLRHRGQVGCSYLLGGAVAALREVFEWVAAHANCRVPRSLPLLPFLALGHVAQGWARIRSAAEPPRVSAAALRFLRHSWAFSSAKAEALGYRTTSLEDGLLALWTDLHAQKLVNHAPPAAVPAA